MNRINIATRGIGNWQERLANPEKHWKRTYSAFETAVSWELADKTTSGLPEQLRIPFEESFGAPKLLLAVAEHKVSLAGGRADSQNDVWALVQTAKGIVSLTVEAKASESFGDHTLSQWLEANDSRRSQENRRQRKEYVLQHLPVVTPNSLDSVAYQILHRCASAVIEAKRFGLSHAAFVVQAFDSPTTSFQAFAEFATALGLQAVRGKLVNTVVDELSLSIGWIDCPLATDRDIVTVSVLP